MSTKIEWTDETWNPVTGCDKVSPGCDHCYAEGIAHRFEGTPQFPNGFAVTLHPERLNQPLRWRKPRRVFVNSMSDLFHDDVPTDYLAQVFAVMACGGQHTFQVLTKRHARMRSLLSSAEFQQEVRNYADVLGRNGWDESWPVRNVWLGVSAENQKWADIRIPVLLDTPAVVRFVSAEPLLGPITLAPSWLSPTIAGCWTPGYRATTADLAALAEVGRGAARLMAERRGEPAPAYLDWVIVGGESGPGARPMDPAWPRSLRDQCTKSGVAFHFKQWGEWTPTGFGLGMFEHPDRLIGAPVDENGLRQIVRRVGKKRAGRELDGRTWDQFPEVQP